MSQTVRLVGDAQRGLAHRLIDSAPPNAVVTIKEAGRSPDQNAKMWAMLSDISRAKPEGRRMTADKWKAVFMQACGHAVQFEMGLDGSPFPVGYSSSRLSVSQMRDLIEFIYEYGARHDVKWSEPAPVGEAA